MNKETVTTVQSETISNDRRENLIIRGLFDNWQLLFLLAGGIVAIIKFYFTVNDLAEGQKKWQESSETRRERTHDALDSLDNRLIRVEKDIEWLSKRRSNG